MQRRNMRPYSFKLPAFWILSQMLCRCAIAKCCVLGQAGYSSVGRASDCSLQQQSDGPWFDSGWPDIETPVLRGLFIVPCMSLGADVG